LPGTTANQPGTTARSLATLHERVLQWYAGAARPLPWRDADTTPWGVLVSEVMAQQTPLARVEPVWREWMSRWPTPAALGSASPGEAVRAWGRLGYPRRALRLHEAARSIVADHDGQVPDTEAVLRTLPGVGSYTAAAVACFAFGVPSTVVDINVRRVLARVVGGSALPAASLTVAERTLAAQCQPAQAIEAVTWNVAAMELGALICTARSPRCDLCPVADVCAWQVAGRPPYDGPARRGQSWAGTDRQCRGVLLQVLRDADGAVGMAALKNVWSDDEQRLRCLDALVVDGLVEPLPRSRFRLPTCA
jgi:A/G-specific adenine glycosylase